MIVHLELSGVLDLDFLQLNGRGLLYLVHVFIIEVVDLVRRAGSQDQDAFQNGNDKLRVQTRLQEGVQRVLLHDLVKLCEADPLVLAASGHHPHVEKLGAQDLVTEAAQSH